MRTRQPLSSSIRAHAAAAILGVFLLAVPLAASAQAPARIGVLVPEMGRPQSQAIKGLSEELRRLGLRERRNFFLDTRNVKNNRVALQPAAAELTAKKVTVIFTTGTSATRAALAATANIPVVFVHPGDPSEAGIVKGSARAKNLTGVAAYAGETLETRMAIFKEIMPALRTIVVFYDANNAFSRASVDRTERAAAKLAMQTVGYGVKSGEELKTTAASLKPESGMAIFQVADELVESEAEYLLGTARAKKLPTIFNEESWAIIGALAAYGPNYLEMGRQAGRLVDRIIKGEAPDALPLERVSKFDLTLNYRTATFIGFQFPDELLKKADKVIR